MDLLQLLIVLVIAGICGAFAQLIVGFSPRGLMVMPVSIIIGVVGAYLGTGIANLLGISGPDIFAVRVSTIRLNLLWAIIGSSLLLLLLQILRNGVRIHSLRRT